MRKKERENVAEVTSENERERESERKREKERERHWWMSRARSGESEPVCERV